MKYKFQLPDFPNSNFEIKTSIWTGKSILFKDNVQVGQSNETGKPFLIPNETGSLVMAFPKKAFPDFVPTLEINGIKYHIVEKLKWYQVALGGFPILLLFIGGALGGAIGALGTIINFTIFRQVGSDALKYLKVLGVIIASFTLYFILAITITEFIK